MSVFCNALCDLIASAGRPLFLLELFLIAQECSKGSSANRCLGINFDDPSGASAKARSIRREAPSGTSASRYTMRRVKILPIL
jgi:hypothetical protein